MTRTPRPLRRPLAVLALLVLVLTGLAVTAGGSQAGVPARDRGAAHPARIVWPGYGVAVWRASGQLSRLARTSPGFRALVKRELDHMFHGYLDSDPACAQAPLVEVKEFRRSGFAFISDEGTFTNGPGHPPERCASGGAARIYVRVDGVWKAPVVLGAQEPFSCRVLRRWDVPRMSGTGRCYDAQGQLVPYRP